MSNFPQGTLDSIPARPLFGSSRSKGYGAIETTTTQEPKKGDFQGVSIRESIPSEMPFLLELIGNPVKTAISAGNAVHHAIKTATENPASGRLFFANQIKESWKDSYSDLFAQRCSDDRCDKASLAGTPTSKAQQQSYYQTAKAACNAIIDGIVDEAIKYESTIGKTGPLEKAARLFQSRDISHLALSRAFGAYADSFSHFNESAFGHQSSEISGNAQAISSAIREAINLMGTHWTEILKSA